MIKNMKVDLVFLNPDRLKNIGDFSIFKHLNPNIKVSLSKAFKMS